jgi:hypothetical protein
MESIDEILRNLQTDANYYNHGTTQQQYLESEQRD